MRILTDELHKYLGKNVTEEVKYLYTKTTIHFGKEIKEDL